MTIEKNKKSELIKEFGTSQNDTGSVEVQAAVLTERIKNITEHCKTHAKDFSSRRGLLMLVARRKAKFVKTGDLVGGYLCWYGCVRIFTE